MGFKSFSLAYFGNVDPKIFFVLSFLVPSLVRALPEVLVGKYVVGFDTIGYYIPNTLRWVNDGVGFLEFVASAPLFYVLLVQLVLAGVPLVVSLKVLPPILLGCLGLVIYVYARRVLAWSSGKALFVSCLATLYFVALRISWDMLRNELGLIFLFVFLTLLHVDWVNDWRKCCLLLLPTTVLVVLSHQLMAVIMFVVILAWVLQKMVVCEYGAVRRLVLCSLPAALLFGLMIYANFMVPPDFSLTSSFPSKVSSGWFSLFGFSSYFEMTSSMLGFLAYCYLPVLVFIWVGIRHFRNLELKAWSYWCLFAAVSPVFSPSAFVRGGCRWTLLLVFPVAFFVVEGIRRFGSRLGRIVFGVLLVLLSLSYVLLPAEVAFPYFGVFTNHVPSSMLQNSVPLSDCDDVVTALFWVGDNWGSDEALLVHDGFHGWALTFLDRDRVVCYGYENPREAVEKFGKGYSRLFLIWWVSCEGWHGVSMLPFSFTEVFRSNRIAIYEYSPTG